MREFAYRVDMQLVVGIPKNPSSKLRCHVGGVSAVPRHLAKNPWEGVPVRHFGEKSIDTTVAAPPREEPVQDLSKALPE